MYYKISGEGFHHIQQLLQLLQTSSTELSTSRMSVGMYTISQYLEEECVIVGKQNILKGLSTMLSMLSSL